METLKTSDQVQVDLSRRYTLEEFLALPKREDGARYELIEGRLYLIPPPDPIHEKLAANMAGALSKFLTDNKIDGEIHLKEPICRSAEGSTDLEPDLM